MQFIKYLLLIFMLISSCTSEEQKYVNELSGEYELQEIVLVEFLYGEPEDGYEFPKTGSIFFGKCSLGRKKGNYCDGYYQFGSDPKVDFTYQPYLDGDSEVITMNAIEPNDIVFYVHGFRVNEKDSKMLVMEAKALFEINSEIYHPVCKFYFKKKN